MDNATYDLTETHTEALNLDIFTYAMAYALLTSQMPYAALTAVRLVLRAKEKKGTASGAPCFSSLDLFDEIVHKLPFLIIADNHRPEHPLIIKGDNLYQIIPGISVDNALFADFVTSDRYLTSAIFDNLDVDALPREPKGCFPNCNSGLPKAQETGVSSLLCCTTGLAMNCQKTRW